MSEDERTRVNINWTKIIAAFVTATLTLVGTLGTVYLKHALKTEKPDPITRSLQKSQALNSQLQQILRKTRASRITVAQFHNGAMFASGQPYEKISTTHQVVARGVSKSKTRINGLPITLFEDVLLKIQEKDVVRYESASEIPNVGSIFKEEGVMATYIFKLESVDGKFIGVMFVEYTSGRKQLSQDRVDQLSEEARAVGSYLSSGEHQHNN